MTRANIVVAEDEKELQLSLSIWLRSMGHNVTVSSNGREAFRVLIEMEANGTPCDLLICDIQMPDMTGEELIEILRSKEVDIPVLAVSGYGSKALLLRLIRLGCDDFIDKPFTPDVLSDRVQKILNDVHKRKKKSQVFGDRERYMERTQQVIHDINNLLGLSVGYTDMAIEALSESDAIKHQLTIALHSSEEAAKICHMLSDLNALTVKAEKVRTNLNLLVHRMVGLLTGILPTNITLLSRIPKLHIWVDGDADRIQQALLNLGLNAFDAMREGGKLVIELSCDGLVDSEESDGINITSLETCRISITDTGKGVEPAIIDRIFEKGFTTKSMGNGIGLYAVKQIAVEHHGDVTVQNRIGGGACFFLTLPIKKVQTSAESSCPPGDWTALKKTGHSSADLLEAEKK